MTVRVTVRKDKLDRLQSSISANSTDAVKQSANTCAFFAAATSPVRTGALRTSWYVSGPGDESDYPERSNAAREANPQAIILDEAKAALVDPSVGQLRNNLGQFSHPECIVSSAVNYSLFLEEGTRYMAPRPILRPASEQARNQLLSLMAKVADV